MKKLGLILSGGVFCCFLWSGSSPTLTFHAPTFEEPFFRIRASFEAKTDRLLVQNVLLNGARPGPFLIFRAGKNVAADKPLDRGAHDIVLDYAWQAGKTYQLTVTCVEETTRNSQRFEFKAVSPPQGGIPGGSEGFCRVFKVENDSDLDRDQEIVILTLAAPKAEVEGAQFILYDGLKPIPFVILERKESVPPALVASSNPVTMTYKMALPVDVKARRQKLLFFLQGTGGPGPESGIDVSGEGLGKTVKNSRLKLEFHPQSGQVNTIEALEPGIKLFNKAGVIHWNPDVFVPGVGWDHSFDWNPPAVFEEKTSALIYLNARRGPLPRVQGVDLEVKYTLEAGAPYFISETRLTFAREMGVIAVRNDEMVLFRELCEMLIYKDKKGAIIRLPLEEKKETPYGLVHIAPDDVDWAGLLNSREGFGYFSLRLAYANANLEIPGSFFHKAGTYFYAPSDGDYIYWVRPIIYTWADFFTKDLFAYVPAGSFFYEKNAYLVTRWSDDLPQKLESLLLKLRRPLRVI